MSEINILRIGISFSRKIIMLSVSKLGNFNIYSVIMDKMLFIKVIIN